MNSQASVFFRLYWRPVQAMGELMDEWRFVPALLVSLAVAIGLQIGRARPLPVAFDPDAVPEPFSLVGHFATIAMPWMTGDFGTFWGPLLSLLLIVVPISILASNALERNGSLGVVFPRDYLALAICTLVSWAAAYLPLAVWHVARGPLEAVPYLGALSVAGFGFLLVQAVRVVRGAGYSTAVLSALGAFAAVVGVGFLPASMGGTLPYLASPWLLYYFYGPVSGELGNLGIALSSRQSLKRQMLAAAINPNDADAQYQLGLLHMNRHETAQAVERFQNAIRIAPREPEAYFQLGVLQRRQKLLDLSLGNLRRAAELDPSHAQGDVWRELGATYLEAGAVDEASKALLRYGQQRPYDPEGQVLLGRALTALGRHQEAQAAYRQALEAAETAPRNRRGAARPWGNEARAALKR